MGLISLIISFAVIGFGGEGFKFGAVMGEFMAYEVATRVRALQSGDAAGALLAAMKRRSAAGDLLQLFADTRKAFGHERARSMME